MIKINAKPTPKFLIYYSIINYLENEELEDKLIEDLEKNFEEYLEVDVDIYFQEN